MLESGGPGALRLLLRGHGFAGAARAPTADALPVDGLLARGIVRLWTDNLADARADLSLAIQKARAGRPTALGQAVGALGHAAFRLGRLAEAVEHGEAAVAVATEARRLWELPMLHGLAALPHAARGDFEEAERHVALACEWADCMGARSAHVHASSARAYLAQARDDADALHEAALDFTEAYGSLDPGVHAVGPVLAESLVALGRLDEATSAMEDFESVVRATGRLSARRGRSTRERTTHVCPG